MPAAQTKRDGSCKRKKRQQHTPSPNNTTLFIKRGDNETVKEFSDSCRAFFNEDIYVTPKTLLDAAKRLSTSANYQNLRLCGWCQFNAKDIISDLSGLTFGVAKQRKAARPNKTVRNPCTKSTHLAQKKTISQRPTRNREAPRFTPQRDIQQYIVEYREAKFKALCGDHSPLNLNINSTPAVNSEQTSSSVSADLYR